MIVCLRTLAAVIGLAVTGCGQPGAAGPADPPGSPWIRGRPLASSGAEAGVAKPAPMPDLTAEFTAPGQTLYRSTLEPAKGSRFMLIQREEAGTPDRPAWVVRRMTGDSPEGPWKPSSEDHLVLAPEGHLALAREVDSEESVESVFEPPLVLIPAHATLSGPALVQTTHLRVHPLGRPDRVRAQGRVEQTIAAAVETGPGAGHGAAPAGPAVRLDSTFKGSLAPAEVLNLTRQWFAPGRGLVGEESEERTKVFGIETRHNRAGWTVVEAR